MSAIAVDWNVMFDPPVKMDMRGVRSVKWPVTVTVTRLAGFAPVAQAGLQATATSLVLTSTNEPADSLVAAHMIRLLGPQAVPAANDVGL